VNGANLPSERLKSVYTSIYIELKKKHYTYTVKAKINFYKYKYI